MEIDVKNHGIYQLGCGFRAESNPQGQNKAAAGLSTGAVFYSFIRMFEIKRLAVYISINDNCGRHVVNRLIATLNGNV